jgi:hypothetical protein
VERQGNREYLEGKGKKIKEKKRKEKKRERERERERETMTTEKVGSCSNARNQEPEGSQDPASARLEEPDNDISDAGFVPLID